MQGIPSKIDYTNKRFGRLLVIERAGKRNGSWKCICDCGKTVILPTSDFVSGKQIACGCRRGKGQLLHGMWNTTFYKKWDGIHRRCTSPNNHNYANYGGRGIKCEWNSFEEFKRDMYESYLEFKKNNYYVSIERIDNDGNYSKQNCKWAGIVEQSNNRRTNLFITFKGKRQTLTQWATELGIPKTTLWGKYKRGVPMEELLK